MDINTKVFPMGIVQKIQIKFWVAGTPQTLVGALLAWAVLTPSPAARGESV